MYITFSLTTYARTYYYNKYARMCMGSAHSCALPELYYTAEAHEGHGE